MMLKVISNRRKESLRLDGKLMGDRRSKAAKAVRVSFPGQKTPTSTIAENPLEIFRIRREECRPLQKK
jgi:hypothetical protein